MELTSLVVYVEDGAVPATLEFYERALGLTCRFYDPDYHWGVNGVRGCHSSGCGTLSRGTFDASRV